MLFLRTLLMFVFVFGLMGISKSFTNEISNCSTCGNIINKETGRVKNKEPSSTQSKPEDLIKNMLRGLLR